MIKIKFSNLKRRWYFVCQDKVSLCITLSNRTYFTHFLFMIFLNNLDIMFIDSRLNFVLDYNSIYVR